MANIKNSTKITKLSTKVLLVWLCSMLVVSFSYAQSLTKAEGIGVLMAINPDTYVIRNKKRLNVGSFGLRIKYNDTVKTSKKGNAEINLDNGDSYFLGGNSEMVLDSSVTEKKKKKKSDLVVTFWGKLRAVVNSSRRGRVQIKTPTATIGVKGTDFVVKYSNNKTTVGTLHGLVNMKSNNSDKSIDIPKNRQSFVDKTGEIGPLSQIAGEILEGLEFTGAVIEGADLEGEAMSF